MNKFINLRNGRINVTSYRYADHLETTLDDLITCAVTGSEDYLTTDFDADELCKHPRACDFLNQYAVKCGSRRGGTEILLLSDEEFAVLTNNTVVVGWQNLEIS